MKYFPEYDEHEHELDERIRTILPLYRELLGFPVTITSGYGASHATNSEHGETKDGRPNSMAVDITSKAPLFWQYACAERAGFVNIGLYPMWNGLHVGVRGNERRRWIGLGSGNTQEYVEFNLANIKEYII